MNGIGRIRRMARARKSLDSIQIAKPCSANWEEMAGDEKVRFCAHCKLNVFNLSAMELDEAARVIAEKDGRLCVRFYRRSDGTTITKDCPVGVASARRRMMMAWSSASGLAATFILGIFGWNRLPARTMMGVPPPIAQPKPLGGGGFLGGIGMGKPVSAPQPLMGARRSPTEELGKTAETPGRPEPSISPMQSIGDTAGWRPDSEGAGK